MSTINTAPQRPKAVVGGIYNFAASFVGSLDSGELLTGTPTIVEVSTTDLTIVNKTINTAALTINQRTVPIGMAVQCSITGHQVTGSPYKLKITGATDATPAQSIPKYVIFPVEA